MKTLILLRHAKSGWDDPVANDFDRPLNAKGRRAAQAVGREMRSLGIGFDAVLASPALRVVETVAEAGRGFGEPIRPAYDRRLYLASPATLIERVRGVGDEVERLLLVGHNPGLERLAVMLTRDDGNALRVAAAEEYPTATVGEIALPVERWRDVGEGRGRLERFIRPRDIDPALGPETKAH